MNTLINWSTIAANLATVATAVVVVWAWVRFRCERKAKKKRLTDYLKEESPKSHSVVLISKETGLSEADIFNLSADKDSNIGRLAKIDPLTGLGEQVLFFYKEISN